MAEEQKAAAPAEQTAPPADGGATAPPADTPATPPENGGNLEKFGDIEVEISAILGNVNMPIEQFLKLGRGAIIELDRHKDEDIDILINGHLVAKGEITVVDERVGISVTQVVKKP